MSELKVNKISPQSGTAFTLGDSGDTFTVPSGATLTVAGTLTQTGAQTFDGGVDIDNFNINGTTIALSSGDMTLDVAGDIILNADGGDIKFADASVDLLSITNSSSDVVLKPLTDTKDIIFQQYDGTEVARIEDNATFNVSSAGKFAYAGTAVTATAAELNILDGVTATAAEINLIDGGTARGTTAIADGDGVLINDAGTMRQTTVETLKTYIGGGITEADVWRITASFNGTAEPVTSNWERADDATAGKLGTGMSESSGIFTFPSTGIWRVSMFRNIYGNNQTDRGAKTNIDVSSDSGSNYDLVSFSFCSTHSDENVGFVHSSSVASAIIDVTNASNFRVRFDLVHINSSAATYGDSGANLTWAEFVRLGDT